MPRLATKFCPKSEAFERASQAGFRNAEFWLDAEQLGYWRHIADQAQRYEFGYAIHFPNRGEVAPETLRQAVDLYRAVNATAMIIHQPMFDKYSERLLALDPTLDLAVENHRLLPAELTRWAEANPGLTLDVEHVWMATLPGASLEELLGFLDGLLARYHQKLQHVHLPGFVPGECEHCPMHHSPRMVTAVLDLLAKHGFGKLVVSEVNPEFQTLTQLRQDVQLYGSWLGSAVAQV